MDTRQLQTLLAIADHGSFARAAALVNLTPSAVSQQIQALEEELGTPLFDRSRRPPSLNAKGAELVHSARTILQLVDETRAAISGGRVTGTLNIGALRSATFSLIPAAMADLRRRYSELGFRLHVGMSEDLMNDVAAGRLDVAVVAEHVGVPKTLKWTPFLREPLVLIAPCGTPAMPAHEMLASQPYIRYETKVPLANQIDTEISRLGITPHEVVVVNTIPAVVGCVAAGLGVAVIPLIALQDEARRDLVWQPFGAPPNYRQIGIVQRQTSARSEVIEAFRQALSHHGAPLEAKTAPASRHDMPA